MAHNPFLSAEQESQWYRLYLGSKLGVAGKIKLVPRVQTHEEVASVMRASDVFVALSRGESWNLELLEAMSCGKPVIATNYSGHTEYCTSENAHLIGVVDTEPAYDPPWFSGQGNWATIGPDQIEQAVIHMRQLHALRQEKGYLCNAAGIETAKGLSWENTATKLIDMIYGAST
jgi:glycosyltransferase involved in cell wall biosynthesis